MKKHNRITKMLCLFGISLILTPIGCTDEFYDDIDSEYENFENEFQTEISSDDETIENSEIDTTEQTEIDTDTYIDYDSDETVVPVIDDNIDDIDIEALAKELNIDCSSNYRDPNTSWKVYYEYCNGSKPVGKARGGSTLVKDAERKKLADALADGDFSNVPEWTDADIRKQFRRMRDMRYMYDSSVSVDPNFLRRIPWLRPRGSCYARAELACELAGDDGMTQPFKLFAFGDLVVETENTINESGEVTWSNHVAPIIKSSTTGIKYILDPAVDPSKPLTVENWLLRMVPSLNDVEIVITDSNSLGQNSYVTGGNEQKNSAEYSMSYEPYYDAVVMRTVYSALTYEWELQVELGRDPYEVLGDNPPWGRETVYFISPGVIMPACHTCYNDDVAFTQRCNKDCP